MCSTVSLQLPVCAPIFGGLAVWSLRLHRCARRERTAEPTRPRPRLPRRGPRAAQGAVRREVGVDGDANTSGKVCLLAQQGIEEGVRIPLHRRCFGALHAIQQRDSVHLSACSNTSSGGLGGRSRAHAITSSTSRGVGDRRALPAHIGSQTPAVAPPRNERVDSGDGEWEQRRGQDEQHDEDGGDHDFSHFSARRSGWSSTISRRSSVCCGFGVCDRRERYGGRRCATRSSTAQLSPTHWLMETSHLLA